MSIIIHNSRFDPVFEIKKGHSKLWNAPYIYSNAINKKIEFKNNASMLFLAAGFFFDRNCNFKQRGQH